MWELGISIASSSFPKILHLASVVSMHCRDHYSSKAFLKTLCRFPETILVFLFFSPLRICPLQHCSENISINLPWYSWNFLCLFNLERLSGSSWAPPSLQTGNWGTHWTLFIHCLSPREHWTAYYPMPGYFCFICFAWLSHYLR